MTESLASLLAALIVDSGEELHWTVILDRALRQSLVPPSPDARSEVLSALAEAVREGLISKTSIGTYASGA